MAAAMVVIPLAAMLIPIVLILLAVLVDVVFLGWMAFRLWHDEYGVRIGSYISSHVVDPVRSAWHPHHPIA